MSTPFHTRADWGARPPKNAGSAITSLGITAHYGGDSMWGNADRSSGARFAATTDHNRCATIVRQWQNFHMDGKGWSDIAYNSVVCPHGHRYEGRGDGRRSGANGTNDGNSKSEAVCYIAGGSDPLTDAAKRAYHDEAARFGEALRWNHSDWKATSCAGQSIKQWQAAGWPEPEGEDELSAADIARLETKLNDIHGAVIIDIAEGRSDDSVIGLIYRNTQEVWQEQTGGAVNTPAKPNGTPAYENRAAMMRDVFNVPDMVRTIEDKLDEIVENKLGGLADEIVERVLEALKTPPGS